MCKPTFYGIEYEINPWMDMKQGADRKLAISQWEQLSVTLTQLGAMVQFVDPVEHLPDMVFTANAGLVSGNRVILSNFRHKERQGEAPQYQRWFEVNGYTVETLPKEHPFEGEGDALFVGQILFAGYIYRSDVYSHDLIAERLGIEVLSLQLTDPRFYHLDTCFCPLAPDTAAYVPTAFDDYARKVLTANIPHLIEIGEADAEKFAANTVVLGSDVVMNAGCDAFARVLEDRGFCIHPVDLSQFLRAGGSAKCLVLRL